MIPYKSYFPTAVPQNPEVWHEIFKAAQTLANDDELVRQRREEIASIRNELEIIRKEITELCRNGRSLILFELRKYGYNPEESRVPKHHLGGGEWTDGDQPLAQDDTRGFVSDAFPPYRGRGHTWVPTAVYTKYKWKDETLRVFKNWTSGPLADPTVNNWSPEHDVYNDAVDELLKSYLKENNVSSEEATPAQAREIVEEVLGSRDQRIRALRTPILRESLRYLRVYGPERWWGGGDEQ